MAPADGVVAFSGTTPGNGLTLSIRTGDGYTVSLTHLGSLALRAGASVDEAAPLGTIGPSGTPELDVPYVHLGIRTTGDENGYLDPLSLLPPRVVAGASAAPALAAAVSGGRLRRRRSRPSRRSRQRRRRTAAAAPHLHPSRRPSARSSPGESAPARDGGSGLRRGPRRRLQRQPPRP